MHVHYPFMLDGRGQVADASHADHLRQLIEQVLFTAPGERVNRPDFGCGLLLEMFSANNPEERIATQFLVQQALAIWLGKLIETRKVELLQKDEKLNVLIEYVDLKTRLPHSVTFEVSAQ